MKTYDNEKFLRQLNLEKEQLSLGYEKKSKILEDNILSSRESSNFYGVALLKKYIEPISISIKNEIEKNKKSKGRKNDALKFLEEFENIEIVAYLSLRQVLNSISNEISLSKLSISIGNLLDKELQIYKLKKEYPEIYKKIEKFYNKKTENYRYLYVNKILKEKKLYHKSSSSNLKVQVGTKLIDIISSSLNIIKINITIDKWTSKQINTVSATKECLNIIKDYKNNILLTPEYLPMIVPPKNWTNPYNGGYYSFEKQLYLVKARFDEKKYLSFLDENKENMPILYNSINALQNTAFKINKKVLNVMTEMYEKSIGDILPKKVAKKLPVCPICNKNVETNNKKDKHICFLNKENKEKFIKWKKEADEVKSYNNSLFGKQIQISKILYLAHKFRDEDEIYFPYQLDFRGRAYAVTSYLQPQGSDFAKGLLTFAVKLPLIDFDSVKWLAIYGANLYGNDKISYDDRLLWVLENEENIIESAKNPLKNTWWTKADKPFQFLAFVFEWNEYIESCLKEEVFYSSLPIAMDGTCNGLQIFSILTRDKEAGIATNLIDSTKPMDIYGVVAEKVIKTLEYKKLKGEIKYKKDNKNILYDEKILSKLLLDLGIDRKTTKRQVMTLPYGATQNSCKEYTYEWLLNKKEENKNSEIFKSYDNLFVIAIFLSQIIWQSISDTLIGAKKAMEYLKNIAEIATNNKLPLSWTTPIGFKVVQAYKEEKRRRVKTLLGGSITFISLKEETSKIDVRFQKNGISPNYIHSLDAAAMMKTIDICLNKGVTSFLTIHDSFATHAAKGNILASSIREAFYNIFQEDLLEKFKNEILKGVNNEISKKLDETIEKGNLNLDDILRSKYFFG